MGALDGDEHLTTTETFRKRLSIEFSVSSGRDGGIRTPDILLPKQARYQAALHPDIFLPELVTLLGSGEAYITDFSSRVKHQNRSYFLDALS